MAGFEGPPFRWDPARRFALRCELDAAFVHLYLPCDRHGDWLPASNETADDLSRLKASFPRPRHAVDYILDTFPIVRKNEEDAHGKFRTKRVILEVYDAMTEATLTGEPYRTGVDPGPGDGGVRHGPRG